MANNEKNQENNGKKKLKDLEYYKENPKGKKLTTNHGVKLSHTDDSLKVGERGPTLMEDFHFREKITHFDHERIPERVVHARGAGAHGYFECYESMEDYTTAKFLDTPGKQTPVFVRFSTVAGFRGSADTVRDVRGFATKFYTEEGNYDLVGNNIPVFFIQDAIKFPDLIHAVKPEPDNEIPQGSTAHDTFYDFVVHTPETSNMVMWVLSDRAIPRSYRMMEGFSVNTFRFVNADGEGRFIKFIWKPLLGVHSMVWEESQTLAGLDPDFHRADLYDAIEMGQYPEYELYVQMVEEDDEHKFDFDILDPTKHWPEEQIPPKKIGKLTLNKNPDNFFAEVEQVAFHPVNVVPGIDFSNDPLLQGRLFSYEDTQLIRLGGPNFHEIPINRPISQVHNNQRDGYHRMTINTGKTSYFPNGLDYNEPDVSTRNEGGYVHFMEKVEGKKIRERSDKFKDHYSQASAFYNSMSEVEKNHIISAFQFEVGKVKSEDVRKQVVDQFSNVDKELSVKIAEFVGVSPPPNGFDSSKSDKFPSFSMEDTIKNPDTLKIAILLENGFNPAEFNEVVKAIDKANLNYKIVATKLGKLKADNGDETDVDQSFLTSTSLIFDALYIPGGKSSVNTLLNDESSINFINNAFKHCNTIGATGEGVELLDVSCVRYISMENKDPEKGIISSYSVVTASNNFEMPDFTLSFVDAVSMQRHWKREVDGMV